MNTKTILISAAVLVVGYIAYKKFFKTEVTITEEALSAAGVSAADLAAGKARCEAAGMGWNGSYCVKLPAKGNSVAARTINNLENAKRMGTGNKVSPVNAGFTKRA